MYDPMPKSPTIHGLVMENSRKSGVNVAFEHFSIEKPGIVGLLENGRRTPAAGGSTRKASRPWSFLRHSGRRSWFERGPPCDWSWRRTPPRPGLRTRGRRVRSRGLSPRRRRRPAGACSWRQLEMRSEAAPPRTASPLQTTQSKNSRNSARNTVRCGKKEELGISSGCNHPLRRALRRPPSRGLSHQRRQPPPYP